MRHPTYYQDRDQHQHDRQKHARLPAHALFAPTVDVDPSLCPRMVQFEEQLAMLFRELMSAMWTVGHVLDYLPTALWASDFLDHWNSCLPLAVPIHMQIRRHRPDSSSSPSLRPGPAAGCGIAPVVAVRQ
jgi:hypothetical protein